MDEAELARLRQLAAQDQGTSGWTTLAQITLDIVRVSRSQGATPSEATMVAAALLASAYLRPQSKPE